MVRPCLWSCALVVGLAALPTTRRVRAEPRLAIVQPGYPGSARTAKAFLRTLSSYLEERTSLGDVEATYDNELGAALESLRARPPFFGVVSLGFYLRYRDELGVKAHLEAHPGERFYVIARESDGLSAADLSGQPVAGGALHEARFLERIVFASDAGAGTWQQVPTRSTSRALRGLERGQYRAVVLGGREFRAFESIGKMKTLEKLVVSEYYPEALVVSFGRGLPPGASGDREGSPGQNTGREPPAGVEELVKAFRTMDQDPSGKEILATMGCEGFRVVRAGWLEELEKRYDAGEK